MSKISFRGSHFSALIVLTLVAAVSACTTQQISPRPTGGFASVAPMLSVERFLQAANSEDYAVMARLFGTHSGPVQQDPRGMEIRMQAVAEILSHDDFEIVSDRREPGREYPTTRIGVDVTKGGRVFPEVHFFVVQTDDGVWLVEEIDLERLTTR